MSTPHPLEEQTQLAPGLTDWDPYKNPRPPGFFGGFFSEDNAYLSPIISGAGQGAALIEQGLGTLVRGAGRLYNSIGTPGPVLGELPTIGAAIEADARERVKRLTPNPATTGTAGQLVSGLASGVYRYAVGSLVGGPFAGAGLIGTTAGRERYLQLREQGVDEQTAASLGALSGIFQGAGALMPAGIGSTLLSRLASGSLGNLGFGMAARYVDHETLEQAGYHEMAKQQRVWDGEALLADMLLGGGFGAVAHLQARGEARGEAAAMLRALEERLGRGAPGAQDAGLALSLASRDDAAAPGVPVNPAAAQAHAAALEQAQVDLEMGRPVNVAGTGVEEATFARRPAADLSPAQAMLMRALQEGGFAEERVELARLEASMGARLRGERPTEPVAAAAPAGEPRNPIEANAEPVEQLRQLRALTAENQPLVGELVADLNAQLEGSRSHLSVKSDAASLAKAERPSILAGKPWFGVDYLRDHLRFKTEIDNVGQLEQIPEVLGEHGVKVLKVDADKMLEPGPWGYRIAALDLQMPNGEMVEHYAILRELNQAQKAEGHRLYEQGRNLDESQPADRAKMYALMERTRALYDAAWEAGLGRTGEDASAVRASIDNFKAKAGSLTIEAVSSRNVPRGTEPLQAPLGGRTAPKPSAPITAREPSGAFVTTSGLGRAGLERRGIESPIGIIPEQIHQVQTATGRQVEVRPKVVEAADLITSDRGAYPAELQPRQRGARAALTEQVNSIARNLNPEMLGNAPEADRGAPIVGPDNVVESGNGRVFALRQVFENRPEQAAAYRAFLEQQGYDVSRMKEPVLVRERATPMTAEERRAFTTEANQTSVAALAPVERAAADARLLDAATLSQLRNGELTAAGNAGFVRAFLQKLPEGERNALVNPDGTVSQEGVRRLQAAILGKAYGGTMESNAVLGRMLESTDTDMRSTMGAMLDAAPAFAKLRQAVADGKVGPEYDLSRPLTQAIEATARVRESGQALVEFLKQEDFLTRRLPVVDQLMRALYDKAGERLAGRDKVAQVLMNYADRAMKQRLDQGMLFGDAPAAPERLLAPPEAPEKTEMRPAADMFGLRRAPATAPDQVARQVLERNPNLEVPDAQGEMTRARAELIAAEEGAEKTEERAPDALSIAAACFGQRGAA